MPEEKPEELRRVDPVPVFHPFLLAIFPVLGLYAHNAAVTAPGAMLRPMLVLGFGAMGLWLALALVLRSVHRASSVSAVLVLGLLPGWHFMLSLLPYLLRWGGQLTGPVAGVIYGAVALCGLGALGFVLRQRGRNALRGGVAYALCAVLLPLLAAKLFPAIPIPIAGWFAALYLLALAGAVIFLICLPQGHKGVTRTMNWFSLLIVLLYAALTAYNRAQTEEIVPPPLEAKTPAADPAQNPSIFVIMLHGYPSFEFLARELGYNALPFWEQMQEMGFERTPGAFANYTDPGFASATCLNMDYLGALAPPDKPLVEVLPGLHRANRCGAFLRGLGYGEAVFATGVEATEPRPPGATVLEPKHVLREFEVVLFSNCIFGNVAQWRSQARWGNPNFWRWAPQAAHVRFAFDNLGEAAGGEAPCFFVANLRVPDPPFLFDAAGKPPEPLPRPSEERSARNLFIERYAGQLQFVNDSVVSACRAILEASSAPPVIWVISGDGYGPPAAIGVEPPAMLYDTSCFVHFPGAEAPFPKSPVNVLRYTLDELFDTGLGLIEEERLYQTGKTTGSFEPISQGPPEPTPTAASTAEPGE